MTTAEETDQLSVMLLFPGLVPTRYEVVADFIAGNKYARERFDVAADVLGYDLREAYRGAEVYDWEAYEAGFMALTLALADWCETDLGRPFQVCGGQSFGAFMAAVWAGALTYPDALRLLQRSVVVETAYFGALAEPLGCHFFYRLPTGEVTRLIEEFRARGDDLELSVVLDEEVHGVSGPLQVLEDFRERVKKEGGYPFYTMNRAEHCPSVGPLRGRLHDEVYGTVTWNEARIPVVSDVDGRLLTDPEEIKNDLLDGWTTPVHWKTILRGIAAAEVGEIWIPGPRNMFGRIANRAVPTRVVTPKIACGA